jgi:hypothetical protein
MIRTAEETPRPTVLLLLYVFSLLLEFHYLAVHRLRDSEVIPKASFYFLEIKKIC